MLNDPRPICDVANKRLIPKPPSNTGSSEKEKFASFARKIFSVTKNKIDQREKEWRERDSLRGAAVRDREREERPV